MKIPLKIAFITGQLGLGGAEKQLFLLARGLLQNGGQVTVISMSHREGEYWEESLKLLGIAVYNIESNLSNIHRLMAIRKILQATGVSVVHSWSLHTNFYAAAAGRLSGVPLRIGSERSNHQRSRRLLGIRYGLCLWGQDVLVVNTRQEGEFLRSYRPNLRAEFVPNGIETSEREISAQEKTHLRKRLGVPNSSFIIGAVGTMVAGKGFFVLLKALEILSMREVPFTLVMIGDGPMLSELKQQSSSGLLKDKVLFTGAIPNAKDWYPAFDLLCMPSIHQEGMPNVIMEASAAGLPVIASHVGGVPDLVEDGITGFLVQPNQVDSLGDKLEKLLVDPDLRQRMGRSGMKKMACEFSVEAMITRMTKIYESAFQSKGLP
jgi:glycosyltransferase involved in cell wall biosynthesis